MVNEVDRSQFATLAEHFDLSRIQVDVLGLQAGDLGHPKAVIGRTVDYSLRSFAPEDLSGWPGKVLLVFGDDDPATLPDVRQRLESLYPGCEVHLFVGAGHTTSVTHQDEYLAVVDGFLSQV